MVQRGAAASPSNSENAEHTKNDWTCKQALLRHGVIMRTLSTQRMAESVNRWRWGWDKRKQKLVMPGGKTVTWYLALSLLGLLMYMLPCYSAFLPAPDVSVVWVHQACRVPFDGRTMASLIMRLHKILIPRENSNELFFLLPIHDI